VNEEGYLTDMSQWNEAIAAAIAAEEGIGPLTDAHMTR
jgi:sulfur relay (sulfurtransferase) DsrC/TusE family protein